MYDIAEIEYSIIHHNTNYKRKHKDDDGDGAYLFDQICRKHGHKKYKDDLKVINKAISIIKAHIKAEIA